MSDSVKLTKADYELFKSEVLRWVEVFNLNDHEINFDFADLKDNYGTMAYNYTARACKISANKSFYSAYEGFDKASQIKETAFHEVAELLLARLNHLAYARFLDEDEIEAETHAIIHRIQKVVINA